MRRPRCVGAPGWLGRLDRPLNGLSDLLDVLTARCTVVLVGAEKRVLRSRLSGCGEAQPFPQPVDARLDLFAGLDCDKANAPARAPGQ